MTVKIDGTNTVANPAFTGADTDTGLQCGTNEVNLVTGGTARLHIDSSGKIGVGTSSPKEVVDARGAAVFSGDHATSQNAYGTAHGIMLSSTSNLASIKAVSNGSNDVAIRFIPLSSGSGSEAMRIASNGNVGIGTSSPGDQLHIHEASSGAANVRFSSTDVPNGFFVGFDGQEVGQIWHTANKDIRIATNNTEQMRITSVGRVGIGQPTPAYKFDLYGGSDSTIANFESNGGDVYVRFKNNTGGHGYIGYEGGDVTVWAANAANTSSQRVARFDQDGLKFGNDTAAVNALDDYEEGTWTGGLRSGNNNASLTVQQTTGYYVKVGKIVTAYWYSEDVNITSIGSGGARITGLPFTAENLTAGYITANFSHCTIFSNSMSGYLPFNSTTIVPTIEHSTSVANFVTGNPKYIMLSITYRAA